MIFRYTILYVSDVRSTIDFYKSAFGFEEGLVLGDGEYGELVTGETKLAFSALSLMEQLGKSPKQPDASHPTFELAFEVEDVQAAYEKALAAGAESVQSVREEEWGQTTSYVRDPNGFLIEMCSPIKGQI